MERPHRLRIVLAAIVAIQVLAGGTLALRALDDPSDFEADAVTRESTGTPLTIESGYPTALQIATDWSENAQLFAVNMQIDWPLSVDPQSPISLAPGGWIAYTFFRSDRDGNAEETLSLFFERTSGVLVQQEVVEWPGNQVAKPLDLQDLAISSAAAIMAVEAGEGRAWRAACPVNRHLTRTSLTANADAAATWVVTYADSITDRAGLLAYVDAERGEITRHDVRSDSCAAP